MAKETTKPGETPAATAETKAAAPVLKNCKAMVTENVRYGKQVYKLKEGETYNLLPEVAEFLRQSKRVF